MCASLHAFSYVIQLVHTNGGTAPSTANIISSIMNKARSNNEPSQPSIRLPRAVVDAMAGAVAGAAARMVVSPLDVIKIRFQVSRIAHGLTPAAASRH